MRLADWREKADLKQNHIAEQIGVTVSQYSKIERGETFVSPKTAEKIRELTKDEVTLNDLHDTWREYQAANAGAAA